MHTADTYIRSLHLSECCFAMLLLLSIQHISVAQEQENSDTLNYQIQEVVITGTRTTERIIDIPYSVFRVDKKELSYGKKTSAKDVLADVPGLFLQSRYGSHDLRISIRGFGTRSNSGIRGVRVLQDGIPESEPDGETVVDAVDFTSLGGVEVVKGNLSSLYANAPGGVVNFISDLYFLDDYVAITNQTGKFGFQQNGFKAGIASNAHRLLLSYNYSNLDGFRKHSNTYQHLFNGIYETYLSDKATVTMFGNYVNGTTKIPGSLTKSEFDNDPFQASPLALSFDFRKLTKKGRAAVRFKTVFGANDNNEIEITGYGGIKELEKADNNQYTISTHYSLGGLARLSMKSEIFRRRNILTVGMDYAVQSGPVNNFNNINGIRDISVQNSYNEGLNNLGFYILDHFALMDKVLDLFVSSRFDRNVFSRDIYIPFGSLDTTRTFQKVTPKAGLSFKITPTVAFYTSYGISFDVPALSEMANSPLSSNLKYSLNPDLNAQQSNNFELGIKGDLTNRQSEFMRKLFFEVTFFNYVIHSEIVPFIINQKTYFENAAQTNRTGIEIGIKSQIFKDVDLITNYVYTEFKYSSYRTTLHRASGDTTADYTNNIAPSVPSHIINFILEHEFEISQNVSGLLQWDCDYVSEMFVNDANSEQSSGYFYANAMAGVNMSLKSFNVIGYFGMYNIFDRRYAGFVNINDFNGRYYESGEPRNFYFGIKLSQKF